MEAADKSTALPRWLEDIGGVGAATVNYVLTGVPLNLGGHLGNGIVGGGDENELGLIGHCLGAIVCPASGHGLCQPLGGGFGTTGNGDHRVFLAAEPDCQRRAHCPRPDETDLAPVASLVSPDFVHNFFKPSL